MSPAPVPPLPSFISHVADLYDAYILPQLPSPVQSISNNLSPLLTSILSAASNGDLVSLAAFLLTVYLTLKIADYIRRSVIGWVVLLVKIAMVLVVLNCVFYVNRYGWQKALNDAEWIFGMVWGFVEGKIANAGDGSDNRTGWAQNQNPWGGVYGGGRQQVPVARGRSSKGKSGFGWT
ncbi:uncharacterized protein Z520_00538 [Fonsecaea multimorphosa CBS 102226]|uniref:Nuclear pore assembly and biogenesis-domain-containing protein n=1 Tax=Fonsecaea multimorphosa CBS 102226 TaxID=1442371 RepID=A0A0D2J356_9EURO|nr:uncharacterized protein Z520_00538 [Fonsecaea multimorphosa CBS 102226]KIY03847.1 hypothetical protein Z520_00538 [Fonsecaea multimorphosa CBS 102226]OAL32536.1 hypothetical protein AYO22_00558 [Fonsecaea multimorphosa]